MWINPKIFFQPRLHFSFLYIVFGDNSDSNSITTSHVFGERRAENRNKVFKEVVFDSDESDLIANDLCEESCFEPVVKIFRNARINSFRSFGWPIEHLIDFFLSGIFFLVFLIVVRAFDLLNLVFYLEVMSCSGGSRS
jgi:hypothetical protein